ncbi:MAG: 50S ribosomal protein L20 [Trueperaceae bacterium]|jgi:large subunit ribosomal protein L20|nr:50S ribosomal protein L20 [Trueperaceae bacterium]MCH2666981.1 50S ribosomal protein L20 [Deinococcales bacterium]
MPRAKTGTVRRARHKKTLKQAKGFWGRRSKNYKTAHQTLLNAADYQYRDRRNRKNDFRRLWISRINAAARKEGTTYSSLMFGLRKLGVEINRKVLADLAVREPEAFRSLTQTVKTS